MCKLMCWTLIWRAMKVLYEPSNVVKPGLKLGIKNVISRTGLYDLSIFCTTSSVYDISIVRVHRTPGSINLVLSTYSLKKSKCLHYSYHCTWQWDIEIIRTHKYMMEYFNKHISPFYIKFDTFGMTLGRVESPKHFRSGSINICRAARTNSV